MGDKRKEELKKRASVTANKSVIGLVVLTTISVACMIFLISKFMVLDVIVPDITMKTVLIGVSVILLIISSIAISNAKDLSAVKDIVLDNKIILEDTVSMESMAVDEIIQLKEIVRDIKSMVE